MRFGIVRAVAAGAAVLVLALTPPTAWTQPKKLVFWTHWEQNPEFNKWYETKGKEFAQEVGLRGRGRHGALPGLRGQVPGGVHGEEQRARHLHGHDAPLVRAVRLLRQDAGRPGEDLRAEPAEVHGRGRQMEGRALRHPHRARQLPADVHQRRHVQEGRPRSGQAAEDVRRLAGGHEEADHLDAEGRRSDAGRLRHPQQGPSGRDHRQVPAVRARLGRPDAVPDLDKATGFANSPRDGGGAARSSAISC